MATLVQKNRLRNRATLGSLSRTFICLLLALTNIACTSLFFLPSKNLVRTPATVDLDYENVYIKTRDDVTLHGWWIQPTKTPVGRVLFLHGNAENISTHFASVLWLLDSGYQVLALDYRGYGLSEGVPDVPEVFEDILSGAKWIAQQESTGPSVIFGQSLGASLAIGALHRFPEIARTFDGLISEAAFSEYDKIASEVVGKSRLIWPLSAPVGWFMFSRHDPVHQVETIGMPVVFVHSVDDQIIGLHHAHDLFAAAATPKQLIETTGGHIQATDNATVREQLLEFIHTL